MKAKKSVVIERQVTKEEYERHVAKMRTLGLGADDVAPVRTPEKAPEQTELANDTIVDGAMVTNAPRASWEGLAASKKNVSFKKLSKPFTLAEKIQDKRHVNALKKFKVQLEEWENFRDKAAEVTKRNANELVITRAEEYRELVELNDLLQRSAPADIQSGGHSWLHSLRGDGSRFVQVGNMFSGLYVPIKMQRENVEQEIKRHPWLRDLVRQRKERQTGGGGPRTWRDDEYLLTRLRRYRKQMHELAPGKLEFDEILDIQGTALRPRGEEEVVTQQSVSKISEDEDGTSHLMDSASLREEESAYRPPAAHPGPHLEVCPMKVELHVPLEGMSTEKMVITNSGTTALMYELQELPVQQGYELSTNPKDPTKHFRCRNPKGTLLPGSAAAIMFSFTSHTAGAFYATWSLSTNPRLVHPFAPILLHGLCTTTDPFVDARLQFERTWATRQIERDLDECVNDVVNVVTASPYPAIDLTEPVREHLEFEEINPSLYYSAELVSQFRDLASELRGVNPADSPVPDIEPEVPTRGFRPLPKAKRKGREQEVWNLDTRELWTLVNGANSPLLQRQLKQLERRSRKRFVESSPSYQLCEELLLEAVENLPPLWAEARASHELPERPRWPIENAEEDLQKGEEEPEKEALETFVGSFGEVFGDAMERYVGMATCGSVMDALQQPSPCVDGLKLVRTRQTTEELDVAEMVVFYEPDVDAIEDAETMKTRMQALLDFHEAGPMALLIVAEPEVAGPLYAIVKEMEDSVEFATPAVIAEAMGRWEDGVPPLVFVVDLQGCPQQRGVTGEGEPMTWADREVWFDTHFPEAYDYYVQDNLAGLFRTHTLQQALGFYPPVRAMLTLIGPYIESSLDKVYKEILRFEHIEVEKVENPPEGERKKPVVVGPKLVTFGGTGDSVLLDLKIFMALLTCDVGPMLLLPPFAEQVCAEIFNSSCPLIREYFASLCARRDIFVHGPQTALFCYTEQPVGIAYDPTSCKLVIEEREPPVVPDIPDGDAAVDENAPAAEENPPADEEGVAAEKEEAPPPPVVTTLVDLGTQLLRESGGILTVGSGITQEFLECVQTRLDKAPDEDDEDEEEEEEDDEDEDEDGEKSVKEEKLGPFEFLGAVGTCADEVHVADMQDSWTVLSGATIALRLLSTRPVGAEALNHRKIG